MTYLALFLLVLDLTGSTAALALISILVALPPVTIGLFAGAFADRLGPAPDHDRVGHRCARSWSWRWFPRPWRARSPSIFVLAATQAVIGTFFSPARTALVPRVVPAEGLLAANSLGQMTRMMAGVVGAGITGVIAGTCRRWSGRCSSWMPPRSWSPWASCSGSAARPACPRSASAASIRARAWAGAVLDGLRLIARSAPLVAALGGVAVTMLGVGAINVLFIPFLVNDLGASPAWAGPLEAAQTVAMVLAGGLIASLAGRVSVPRLFVGGLAGTGCLRRPPGGRPRAGRAPARSCSGRARSRCRSRRRR